MSLLAKLNHICFIRRYTLHALDICLFSLTISGSYSSVEWDSPTVRERKHIPDALFYNELKLKMYYFRTKLQLKANKCGWSVSLVNYSCSFVFASNNQRILISYRTAMKKNSLKKKGETVKKLFLRWQYFFFIFYLMIFFFFF